MYQGGALTDYRDRSSEFFATVQSFQKKHASSSPNSTNNSPSAISSSPDKQQFLNDSPSSSSSSQLHSSSSSLSSSPHNLRNRNNNHSTSSSTPQQPKTRSQFSQAAAHIMSGIHTTSSKLQELTTLTKQTSLYNDPAGAINRISFELKKDMETLQGEIDVLAEFVNSQHVKLNNDDGSNSNLIVTSLRDQLATQTQSFLQVLTQRSESMKQQNERRKEFEGSSVKRKAKHRDFSSLLDDDNNDDSNDVDVESQTQTQHQTQLSAFEENQTDSYLQSRAEAVENIEQTIHQLGKMYKELIEIVDRQHEVAIRIDQNTEEALENVQEGYQELMKLYTSTSSGQWLIVKVFFILLVFSVLFISFVA